MKLCQLKLSYGFSEIKFQIFSNCAVSEFFEEAKTMLKY